MRTIHWPTRLVQDHTCQNGGSGQDPTGAPQHGHTGPGQLDGRHGKPSDQQQVLDLRLRLDSLRVEIEGLKVRGDYRELYLDRSRALYELEVKTDLGDAMTEISALRLDTAFAEFEWMTTQAELAAMAGRLFTEDQTQ